MTAATLIADHAMGPHPFEGYWRETRHVPGVLREGLQLFTATDEAHWHGLDAEVAYTLVEGGPLAITLCADGHRVAGRRLVAAEDRIAVAPGILRAISCLGSHALVRVTFRPDAALTARDLMPDDWYPKP